MNIYLIIRYSANILAVLGAVIGSFLVAANIGLAFTGYGFFLVSSLAALYLLFSIKNAPKALILQNLFFVAVNLIGLFRH